jgi:hypothetical protein
MLPLPIAARALDISHTSLKKLCRELGIVRWPYVRGGLQRFGHRLGAVQEGNAHETIATSSMTNAGSAESGVSEVWDLAHALQSAALIRHLQHPPLQPRHPPLHRRVHQLRWFACTAGLQYRMVAWNLQDWSWTRVLSCPVTWQMTCQLMTFLGYFGIQLAISERAIQHWT